MGKLRLEEGQGSVQGLLAKQWYLWALDPSLSLYGQKMSEMEPQKGQTASEAQRG